MEPLRQMILLLLSIALFNLTGSEARTPTEIRQAVQGKMRERHPDQIEEFWNALGPEALPVLKRMYSETAIPFEKTWIMDGLSHFDDPSIGALLEGEIPKEQDEVMRKKMLSSLIRSQGESAYDFAESYLQDADPHVRQAVAQALKQYGGGGDRVQKRLKDFLQEEKEPWIKTAVENTQAVAKTLKREDSIYAEKTKAIPAPSPLPQANWAGDWKGAWITPTKNSAASVTLVLVNEKATEAQQKWRIELKLPKQSKQDLKERDIEIAVFAGTSVHWLEIRSKKTDAVFIAHRNIK